MCRCCAKPIADRMIINATRSGKKPLWCNSCDVLGCAKRLREEGKPASGCQGPISAPCGCCGLNMVQLIRHSGLRGRDKSGALRDERPFHINTKIKYCTTCQMAHCSKNRPGGLCPLVRRKNFTRIPVDSPALAT